MTRQHFRCVSKSFKILFVAKENRVKIGVGGMVHFLGHGLKLMASPFLFQDNGMNKLIPKFF